MRYTIVFLSGEKVIYIRNDAKIDDGLYEKFVDSKIPITENLSEALFFEDIDLARSYVYKLKYHYRKLFNIKVGIKIVKDNLLEKGNQENEMQKNKLLR